MTKSTITREQITAWMNDANYTLEEPLNAEDVAAARAILVMGNELLAAMDSEPVAWLAIYHGEVYDEAIGITRSVVEAQADHFGWESALTEIIPLYRHAQSAPERDQVRSEHAEWSQATFGDVGPIGPLKHLSKEALEAAAEPGDLSEWADMQFLLWDAQRRAGITDEQITQAMIEKLAVNKQREWPEPKDGEPRLHIKAQPAPVEVRNKLKAEALADLLKDAREYAPQTAEQWELLANNWHQTFVGLSGEGDTCRAAMLHGVSAELKEYRKATRR